MKILFIDPPFQRFMGYHRFYYPLGLASMAAVLQEQGHIVKIYDAEHSRDAQTLSWAQVAQKYDEYPKQLENALHPVWNELRTVLHEFDPDVIGISVLSPKVKSASKVAGICKGFNKNIPIIAGADHPTIFPAESLSDPNIDMVVRGEGETTIVELVSHLAKGEGLETIPGISYKEKNEIKHNPARELITNLDGLPYPALEALIGFDTYRPQDFGAIMASRGCPFSCTFCGIFNVWTRKTRFRTPANVVAEIQRLHDHYGVNYFSFRDASFTLRPDLVKQVCEEIIRSGLVIQWECLTRPDLLDDDLLTLMKQAGCVTVRIGVESGSEEILRYMKKNTNLDVIRTAANLLNKYNFYWSAYFLFGSPLETKETIKQTLDFIKEINPPFVTLSIFDPIPGTEMYSELEHVGLISPGIDWSMESNQRFRSNYVYAMSADEFENSMKEVAAIIDDLNKQNSARLGVSDGRLKE
jgi:anaerobic magnesium-protoporphyrin IX monomethyl ester cyclase